MNKQLGAKLKKARLDLNMSAFDVAMKSGITTNTIYRIERGAGEVFFSTVLALLAAYELPLSYLEED